MDFKKIQACPIPQKSKLNVKLMEQNPRKSKRPMPASYFKKIQEDLGLLFLKVRHGHFSESLPFYLPAACCYLPHSCHIVLHVTEPDIACQFKKRPCCHVEFSGQRPSCREKSFKTLMINLHIVFTIEGAQNMAIFKTQPL